MEFFFNEARRNGHQLLAPCRRRSSLPQAWPVQPVHSRWPPSVPFMEGGGSGCERERVLSGSIAGGEWGDELKGEGALIFRPRRVCTNSSAGRSLRQQAAHRFVCQERCAGGAGRTSSQKVRRCSTVHRVCTPTVRRIYSSTFRVFF